MNNILRSVGIVLLTACVSLCLSNMAFAQYGPPSPAQIAAMKAAAAKPTPHAPDGHPDITGIWFSQTTGRIQGPGALKTDGKSIVINQSNPGTVTPKPLQADDPKRPPYKAELLSKVFDLNVRQTETDPGWGCKNPGIPRLGPPHQVVQTPKQVVFLYSDWSGEYFRLIPTDGRGHNEDAEETYTWETPSDVGTVTRWL